MTPLELMNEYLGREWDVVFRCSRNYRMDDPKRGREREFREAKEKIEILECLIARLEAETGE